MAILDFSLSEDSYLNSLKKGGRQISGKEKFSKIRG
jgi:hypothetical protein